MTDQPLAMPVARPYAFASTNVIDPDFHLPARKPGRVIRFLQRMPLFRWLAT